MAAAILGIGEDLPVTNESSPVQASAPVMTGTGAATARTSTGGGAVKVFREFKWGLLTLFLLMVVVIGLVYDGGRRKDAAKVEETPSTTAALPTEGLPPGLADSLSNPAPQDLDMASVRPPAPVQSPVTLPPGTIRTPDIAVHPPTYGSSGALTTALVTPPSVSSVQEVASTGEYTVQSGDTLEAIARKNYPGRTYTAIKAISEANNISDPRRVRVGTKLKMPALPTQEQANRNSPQPLPASPTRSEPSRLAEPLTPSTPRSNTHSVEGDVYLVQGGDTLERIARRVLNDGRRWREIYEWNRDQLHDPGVLRVGQKLKIKKDATSDAAANPTEASREPAQEQPAQAPRRTVAASQVPETTEEPSAQPQTMERVEPIQRWMP
jgi:nucleoid-associated protein YgaU